jgi:hypothetical protein
VEKSKEAPREAIQQEGRESDPGLAPRGRLDLEEVVRRVLRCGASIRRNFIKRQVAAIAARAIFWSAENQRRGPNAKRRK